MKEVFQETTLAIKQKQKDISDSIYDKSVFALGRFTTTIQLARSHLLEGGTTSIRTTKKVLTKAVSSSKVASEKLSTSINNVSDSIYDTSILALETVTGEIRSLAEIGSQNIDSVVAKSDFVVEEVKNGFLHVSKKHGGSIFRSNQRGPTSKH